MLYSGLPVRIYGDRIIVDFLSGRFEENVRDFLEKLYELDGKVISFSDLMRVVKNFFRDDKFSKFVLKAIKYFSTIRRPSLEDIFGKNIPFDSPLDLKKSFYSWIQNRFGGFVRGDFRDAAIEEFCREFGLNKDSFENFLRIYLDDLRFISIDRDMDASKFIGLVNYLIIESVLSYSNLISIKIFGDVVGGFVKNILFRAKKSFVLVDVDVSSDSVSLIISTPKFAFEFPKRVDIGRRLASVVAEVFESGGRWIVLAEFVYRGKNLFLKLRSDSPWLPKILSPWKIFGDKNKVIFDSRVERAFLEQVGHLVDKIVREPTILKSSTGEIMVPDFKVVCGGKDFFVEIVGYWREDYLTRKMKKLEAFYRDGVDNIILLVDEKLREKFSSDYPILYYNSRMMFDLNKFREIVCGSK